MAITDVQQLPELVVTASSSNKAERMGKGQSLSFFSDQKKVFRYVIVIVVLVVLYKMIFK